MVQVFVSYRHESEEHRQLVRGFCDRLRHSKIDVILDQYCEDENHGAPAEGWIAWCTEHVSNAERILIVTSRGWFDEFDKTAPIGEGHGSALEASIILTQLHDLKFVSNRHRLVELDEGLGSGDIPLPLRSLGRFRPLDSAKQFAQVIDWLDPAPLDTASDQADVEWPDEVEFEADLANRREREWPAFLGAVTGRCDSRILFIQGRSQRGKTTLLREMYRYATEANIACSHIDFKGGTEEPSAVLREIAHAAGHVLPRFSSAGGTDPFRLREDLRELSRPLLLIFDTFEQITASADMVKLLENHLLRAAVSSPGVCVVIGGQRVPESDGTLWEPLHSLFTLSPIDSPADWTPWLERNGMHIAQDELALLVAATKGEPGTMRTLCTNLSEDRSSA